MRENKAHDISSPLSLVTRVCILWKSSAVRRLIHGRIFPGAWTIHVWFWKLYSIERCSGDSNWVSWGFIIWRGIHFSEPFVKSLRWKDRECQVLEVLQAVLGCPWQSRVKVWS